MVFPSFHACEQVMLSVHILLCPRFTIQLSDTDNNEPTSASQESVILILKPVATVYTLNYSANGTFILQWKSICWDDILLLFMLFIVHIASTLLSFIDRLFQDIIHRWGLMCLRCVS